MKKTKGFAKRSKLMNDVFSRNMCSSKYTGKHICKNCNKMCNPVTDKPYLCKECAEREFSEFQWQ